MQFSRTATAFEKPVAPAPSSALLFSNVQFVR
jgi:hypothetical protein